MLAGQLKPLPNHLLLEGHTDAQPYSESATYTNWELSADRANAARRLLQQDGLTSGRISQVRGYADQRLRLPNNPLDPSNRRISLIVQNLDEPSPSDGASVKESAISASPVANIAAKPAAAVTAKAPAPQSAAAQLLARLHAH